MGVTVDIKGPPLSRRERAQLARLGIAVPVPARRRPLNPSAWAHWHESARLPFPISANRYWRINRRTGDLYVSPDALAYRAAVTEALLAQGALQDRAPLDDERVLLGVRYMLVYGPGVRQDAGNGEKVLSDAVAGALGFDDHRFYYIEIERALERDPQEGYVEMQLWRHMKG